MTLEEIIKRDLKKIKDKSETLVGIYGGEKESYLFIGNDTAKHLWAVTEAELNSLYKILKKKYENNCS